MLAGDDAAMGTGIVTIGAGRFISGDTFSTDNPFILADDSATIDTYGYDLTLTGEAGGSGSLNKLGAGMLILDNTTTITGGVSVGAGGTVADIDDRTDCRG